MTNIGFIYLPSNSWMGGKNYFLSLFRQMSNNKDVKVYIFTSSKCDLSGIPDVDNIQVISSKLLSLNSKVAKCIRFIAARLFGENAFMYFLLKKHEVKLLSHAYISPKFGIECMPWIPDFQHKYLDKLFSVDDVKRRDIKYAKYLSSKNVLFSSSTAKSDAFKFYNVTSTPFVYRFSPFINQLDVDNISSDSGSYFSKPFVFLPNQFWEHKNHLVVFEALRISIRKGTPFFLVCTGESRDYRNPKHIENINRYLDDEELKANILCLGLVERSEYIRLMMESEVLINPSMFEGWSSTVEEAKYMSKKLVLSNINVHLEQVDNYPNAFTFDMSNAEDCFLQISNALNSKAVDFYYSSEDYVSVIEKVVKEK